MFSPTLTGSSDSSRIKMLSKDPERYKAQGMADLATHVNNYKGPVNVLRADLQRVTEQKALIEGVLHVIQNFEYPEDWYIVPMAFEKMKQSNRRPFADIIGDMVKTGSIRITDAADLTVEEALDWETKNEDSRRANAYNMEGNRCIAN
ncbi:hypothetical protein EAF00_007043 [Botryotinia globosa]|nr:hypothetical protein EAF00_007043 [Botryotinia globosa]